MAPNDRQERRGGSGDVLLYRRPPACHNRCSSAVSWLMSSILYPPSLRSRCSCSVAVCFVVVAISPLLYKMNAQLSWRCSFARDRVALADSADTREVKTPASRRHCTCQRSILNRLRIPIALLSSINTQKCSWMYLSFVDRCDAAILHTAVSLQPSFEIDTLASKQLYSLVKP